MTVKELINELLEMPMDKEVRIEQENPLDPELTVEEVKYYHGRQDVFILTRQ